MHTQTETMFSPEFGPAAANLAEQSEATCAPIAKEQQRTRTEILAAVANAASGYEDAITKEADTMSHQLGQKPK